MWLENPASRASRAIDKIEKEAYTSLQVPISLQLEESSNFFAKPLVEQFK